MSEINLRLLRQQTDTAINAELALKWLHEYGLKAKSDDFSPSITFHFATACTGHAEARLFIIDALKELIPDAIKRAVCMAEKDVAVIHKQIIPSK